MKLQNKIAKIKNAILYFLLFTFVCLTCGCEAFVRKFTRKTKKENLPREEMVLSPEEYKGTQLSQEEQYCQYFLFWKSWQDELISALMYNASHKKQVDCAEEAIKNLLSLKPLLIEGAQKKLDIYINKLAELKDKIARDLYGNNIIGNIYSAEGLKRNILRDFYYNKQYGVSR